MRPVFCLSLLVALPVPAVAATATPPPPVTRTATVFGNDSCPAPQGDEIIVCGRLPESDRYRIPKQLRKKPRNESGAGASWASNVRSLEAAQRFTMPGSCTAVGSFGQSGCTQAMLRQWFLERQAILEGRQLP